jgi:hypothetical protein
MVVTDCGSAIAVEKRHAKIKKNFVKDFKALTKYNFYENALIPVISRPVMSKCTSSVPS